MSQANQRREMTGSYLYSSVFNVRTKILKSLKDLQLNERVSYSRVRPLQMHKLYAYSMLKHFTRFVL